jgi:methylmalonyl-CoA mutase N-terminal domain/subunit
MNKIDTKVLDDNVDRDAMAEDWRRGYEAQVSQDKVVRNRSGLEIRPLYWPEAGTDSEFDKKLGFPGSEPMTRGIWSSTVNGISDCIQCTCIFAVPLQQ